MINTLVTYLPFNRAHEIELYFKKNIELLKTKRNIVYVDNVFNEAQLEVLKKHYDYVEIKSGNWNDRNLCFLQIIEDAINDSDDILIVDSDNILKPDFQKIDEALINKGYNFYNVADSGWKPENLGSRSKKIDTIKIDNFMFDVFNYKIYGVWKEIFFVGPKQAVRLSPLFLEKINIKALVDLKNALKKLDPRVRNYISDETSIGFVYYYSGIKNVPWIIGTTHKAHESLPLIDYKSFRLIRALTLVKLSKNLMNKNYKRVYWFYFRYKISQIYRSIYLIFE